ncbi:MAG: hypothetical protein AB7I50_16500 [Vicinamibacterales bacterium]
MTTEPQVERPCPPAGPSKGEPPKASETTAHEGAVEEQMTATPAPVDPEFQDEPRQG